jgi:glycosyltransferase involved in cell wall biosynthesis
MLLSIIIPIYNEEKTIIEILQKIDLLKCWKQNEKEGGFSKEVIVVNDGSDDNSRIILEKNSHLYSKLLNNSKNFGKGYAIKKAIKICSGDYIIIQDADNEYDPNDYVKFMSSAESFDADFVIGSRFNYDQYTRSHNFFNKIGNRFITFFFNLLYNTTFTDIYCCYICFKKDLIEVEKIKSNGFEQHAEILCNLVKNGKKFYEVPVNYNGRTVAEGKKIRFYHIIPIFYQILKSKFIY